MGLLSGGAEETDAEPAPKDVPGAFSLVSADARVDRRPPPALADRPRARLHAHRQARERRRAPPRAPPGPPQPHRNVAPRAPRLSRRAPDAVSDSPLVLPRQEAARLARRRRA